MKALLSSQTQVQFSKWTELIVENSIDGIIAVDSSYTIRLFNRSAEKIFGYLAEEVIDKPIDTLIPDCFIETHTSNIRIRDFANTSFWKKDEKKQLYGKRKDGLKVILEASLSKFYCEGQLILTATLRDITERKANEKKLQDFQINLEKRVKERTEELSKLILSLQEETLRHKQFETRATNLFTAIEQTAESIIILNKNGVIDYVNPSFERITGFESKDICHHRAKALVGPTSLKEYKKIAKILINGNKWQGVYWAKKKDGSLYEEEVSILPVKYSQDENVSYVAVCRDITEKKRLESIIDSVDMMKNVGYIFAGIRHELGNPINSIKTSLSVLKKGLDSYSHESILVYIERSLSEITRVEYLLKALKSFSMYENLKLEKVNLVSFMERFCSLAKEDSEKKGIKLNIAYNSKEIPVFIDQRAFHQVMLNIFSNAVDALEGITNPKIDILLTVDDRFVKTEIIDNGIGIPNSQKEKLFKPFHTFKTQGTGLGLVITKKLITYMQGTVEIESTYNSGTRVIISLEK